jgi:Gas vesicle protein
VDSVSALPPPPRSAPSRGQPVALVDLLDRLLAGGVVIAGDITISIADVDLVRISLRAIIASIRPEMARVVDAEVSEISEPSHQVIPGTVTRGEITR